MCLAVPIKYSAALTGVAQWVGHGPTNQKVAVSIPVRVRAPAWVVGPDPRLGACKRQPIDVSLTR